VNVVKLLDGLCVDLGYCLPPDDKQRIIADPPQTIDAFTDAVIEPEGRHPALIGTRERQEVRRIVAAAFGEPISPAAPKRRLSWAQRGHRA
jgi:hypothetical protein